MFYLTITLTYTLGSTKDVFSELKYSLKEISFIGQT